MKRKWLLMAVLLFSPGLLFAAPETPKPADPAAPPAPNLYASEFFVKPAERLKRQTYEVQGLVLVENPGQQPRFSIVTDFGPGALRMQALSGAEKIEDARALIEANVKTAEFEGVEIKQLVIPETAGAKKGQGKKLFFVGHKAFESAEEAKAQIALVQAVAEGQGQNFGDMVQQAKAAAQIPEQTAPVEIKTPAQFQKEEEVMLRFLDQMDIGNELFGPFQGVATGEPITWQSFGETTWRLTNLESDSYRSQVGFWTNRIVFKGIRAPLSTIDPYLEATAAMDSNGVDFKDNLKLWAGAEWRPFGRNPWFLNFRPWSMPLLEWVRNYRVYVQYGDRKNLKDEIDGSASHDLIAGLQIFYEWGIDMPPVGEGAPSTIPDYLRRIFWGEYFGDYRWEKTNFGPEDDFSAFIWNSSVILGIKMPGIPLPENPVNDKLVIMPYFRFEHVNNTEFSFPFQNQYFVAAGARWMPFVSYRFKDNEWLGKTKIFAEYVGVGTVQHAKEGENETPNAITYDFRVGVSMSQKRF